MAVISRTSVRIAALFGIFMAAAAMSSTSAEGAILLLNPSTSVGTSTAHTGTAPYAVPTNATWNNGNTTYPASPLYADGSSASGISIISDGEVITAGAALLDFAIGAAVSNSAGGTVATPSVFATTPAKDFVFSGSDNTADSVVGMRVTGLDPGTYDIYVVAAYSGSTTSAHPGNSNPSQQAVWVFSGSGDTLAYDAAANTLGGRSRFDVMENGVKTWTEGNTFALATVTIDAANPNLYIAASGAETATGLTANSEDRGFINLVQVVPEPGSAGLILAAGGLLLGTRRRRRADRER